MMRPCDECGRDSVTKDGRNLCLKCLKRAVTRDTPMIGCYRGMGRTPDARQDRTTEPSPWQENAVRILEGDV